jgi:hypothetical protein
VAELRALVAEKASKESVGVALHRKASKDLLAQEVGDVKRALERLELELGAKLAGASRATLPTEQGKEAADRQARARAQQRH